MPSPTIVWFRQDLRLADHPALTEAIERGPVVPVYLWSPEEEGGWAPGAASRWWLHHTLASLDTSLRELGSRLVLRTGPADQVLPDLARETGAGVVVWSHRYEPAARRQELRVTRTLSSAGIECSGSHGSVLRAPGTVMTRTGTPFQVFTPFWRACQELGLLAPPLPQPTRLTPPAHWPDSLALESLCLLPAVDWASGLRGAWEPGEASAHARLSTFSRSNSVDYDGLRDRPDLPGTSKLSPYLHHGELSPRQVWHQLLNTANHSAGAVGFLRQIVWREFAYHLLYHFEHTPETPLRPQYVEFPWLDSPEELRAWQQGKTGYPLVDAGMRQLWATGWMHNRVRMVVGSFLVKDLLLNWTQGAKWFWDTLVDADLANNTLGWQWVAGCGADAAPYFRIFNPTTQAEKFDPSGDYVRKWVPELSALPAPKIHRPLPAAAQVRTSPGNELGVTYPAPIVEHAYARERALTALARMKRGVGG